MKHGIVIEGPLKVRRFVLYEQSGDDGRGVAGLCEERDSAEVDGAVEYIAFIGNQCAAKRGIEEVLLSDGPGDDFFGAVRIIADRWIALQFLLGFSWWRVRRQVLGMQIAMGLGRRLLGIQSIDNAILHAAGVSQNVALVETNDVGEIIDAGLVAIDRIGLDNMLHH